MWSLWPVVATIVGLSSFSTIEASAQSTRHAVLIGGLGGTPEHTERFERFLTDSRRGLIEQFDFAEEHIIVLAENSIADRDFVHATSTAENIRSAFAALSERVGANDDVYVLLFGHGSFDGSNAKLNIPRRDLNDEDFAELLDAIPAKRTVFINSASSSGPFVKALSAPDRVVVTATRTGTERNETSFPRFLVEALASGGADQDRNGDISVVELFTFASENTQRSFADAGNLETEHALLDDNGDQNGTEWDKLEGSGDGALASVTYLRSRTTSLAAVPPGERGAAAQMVQRKERLEIEIAAVQSRKAELEVDEYYASLEVLFVELARLNASMESVGLD